MLSGLRPTTIQNSDQRSKAVVEEYKENIDTSNSQEHSESVDKILTTVTANFNVRQPLTSNMISVWKNIDLFRVSQDSLTPARNYILSQLKKQFIATLTNRSINDDATARSVDHDIIETAQFGALMLNCFDKSSKWIFHFKHPLFQMMYQFGTYFNTLKFESGRMIHVNEPSFEEAISKSSTFNHEFFTKPRRSLADEKPIEIGSLDENTQVILPICYGFSDYLTGIKLRNVIENYLDIFRQVEHPKLGAKNITVTLGLYNGIETPIENVDVVAQQKLADWKFSNEAYLSEVGVNIVDFSQLSKSPYFIASMILLNRFQVENQKEIIDRNWVRMDITRYLKIFAETNPKDLVYKELQPIVTKKNKKQKHQLQSPEGLDGNQRSHSAAIPIKVKPPEGAIDIAYHTPSPPTRNPLFSLKQTSPSRLETRPPTPDSDASTSPEMNGAAGSNESSALTLDELIVNRVTQVSLDSNIRDDEKDSIYLGLAKFALMRDKVKKTPTPFPRIAINGMKSSNSSILNMSPVHTISIVTNGIVNKSSTPVEEPERTSPRFSN